MHTTIRTAAALLLALTAGGAVAQALPVPLLPDEAQVRAWLQRSPLQQAAAAGVLVEEAGHRQAVAGLQPWTVGGSAGRRSGGGAPGSELAFSIERPLRWGDKREAADSAGRARSAAAQAAWQLAWRDQARALLEQHGARLRDQALARLAGQQLQLLQQQAQAVARRQRVGDAAPLESLQAEAAVAQAQAALLAAQGREQAGAQAWQRQYPGLDGGLPDLAPDRWPDPPAPAGSAADDDNLLQQQRLQNPALTAARAELAAQQAQAAVDRAERRGDPSVALRSSRAPGGEQVWSVALSMPFGGGSWHDAAAAATAARAQRAQAQLDDLQRRSDAEAARRLVEQRSAHAVWLRSALAATQLAASAERLARSYQLGDGSLAEVLAARRISNDQMQQAAGARVDAWMAVWRQQLELGALWAP